MNLNSIRPEYTEQEKKQGKRILIVILPLILVGISFSIYFNIEWRSVDEAINKYDFGEARQIASDMSCRDEGNSVNGRLDCPRTLQMIKVITSEASYMIENNELTRAFTLKEEINSLELYDKLYEAGLISKTQDELKDDLYLSVLTKGLMTNSLSKEQVSIYLLKISSETKKEQIKNLMKEMFV